MIGVDCLSLLRLLCADGATRLNQVFGFDEHFERAGFGKIKSLKVKERNVKFVMKKPDINLVQIWI